MKNYSIWYTTKKGSQRFNTSDELKLISKTRSLFANKKEAAIYLDNTLIGRIFFDATQVDKWNWIIDFGNFEQQ